MHYPSDTSKLRFYNWHVHLKICEDYKNRILIQAHTLHWIKSHIFIYLVVSSLKTELYLLLFISWVYDLEAIITWKEAAFMNCKMNLKMNYSTTHPSECPKSRALTIPNAGKNVEHQELWQFGSCFQDYTHSCHVMQQLCFLVFTQGRGKLLSTSKPLYDASSTFIHNCWNMKAAKMSFSR